MDYLGFSMRELLAKILSSQKFEKKYEWEISDTADVVGCQNIS